MVIDGVAGGDFSSVLYALNLANPAIQDHLHGGGDGCWVDDGWLMAQVQGRQLQIVRTLDILASLDGQLLSRFRTLAATAAALPLIESGLEIGPILSSMASNDPLKRRGGVRKSARQVASWSTHHSRLCLFDRSPGESAPIIHIA
ncbi:MAG: hypothetical protein R3A46_19185 [Thermomicrobiales bacterium]